MHVMCVGYVMFVMRVINVMYVMVVMYVMLCNVTVHISRLCYVMSSESVFVYVMYVLYVVFVVCSGTNAGMREYVRFCAQRIYVSMEELGVI